MEPLTGRANSQIANDLAQRAAIKGGPDYFFETSPKTGAATRFFAHPHLLFSWDRLSCRDATRTEA
jgi:hypothetical protein